MRWPWLSGVKQLHGAQLWPHGVWCCVRDLPRGWFDVRLPHAARLPPVPRLLKRGFAGSFDRPISEMPR